ncbi:MAG: NAD kinase [Muribaculaceae bacterium]|nr:NAD kinase [Muribaculaceae bacterium]
MKLLIFGHEHQEKSMEGIAHLLSTVRSMGIEMAMEDAFERHVRAGGVTGLDSVATFCPQALPQGDVALSLGGDGTFLSTVMWVGDRGLPILGINTGHLGYLTSATLEQADRALADLVAGRYTIEERSMLRVQCQGMEVQHPYALNEIAILRQDTSSMIEMDTLLRGNPLTTYKGDGLVVSTPTGSTAYNLSAGGPLLEPTTRCIVLSPLSPHSLNMRPLVVGDDAVLNIVTHSRATHYQVSIDGETVVCPTGSMVTIDRAPFVTHVVHLEGHDFARTLRHKLLWGTDQR